MEKTIFWNVDTQVDFMRPEGKLYVPGAETLESNLEKLTRHAEKANITVVSTADWHNKDTKEFSATPDFVNTFPEHCMEYTSGAEYVAATKPTKPLIVNWSGLAGKRALDRFATQFFDVEGLPTDIYANSFKEEREIIIRKDAFDVFQGNKITDKVVDILTPKIAIVYGVATNFCVNYAVEGLVKKGIEVYVVKDAIKEIPLANEPANTFAKWEAAGVKFTTTDEVLRTYRK